ncbi:MAG: peroxidase, partial [Rhizorhabdus sp.]|nr:peroxidase [Rhizorhabdus sp.]
MKAIDEAADIQALVRTGFGSLDGAAYVLLRIADAAKARIWLRGLDIASVAAIEAETLARALQIAFTTAGLRALGLGEATVAGFAPEFVEGLAGSERRSHRLGDAGEDAPEHWEWGHDDAEPHVLIAIFASMVTIDDEATALAGAAIAAGCTLLRINRTSDMAGREPFGFADGLSQPALDWDGAITPGGAVDRDYRNGIAAGEVLIGHPNEYGLIAEGPSIETPDGRRDLGRNGSYLVYRQLAQDVRGFWRWTRETAGANAVGFAEVM